MNEENSVTSSDEGLLAIATKNGGLVVPITRKNEKGEIVSDSVFVNGPKPRTMERYYSTIESLCDFVEFLTGKAPEFVDSIELDSLFEIDRIGKVINDPTYARLWERQIKTGITLKPMMARGYELKNGLPKP